MAEESISKSNTFPSTSLSSPSAPKNEHVITSSFILNATSILKKKWITFYFIGAILLLPIYVIVFNTTIFNTFALYYSSRSGTLYAKVDITTLKDFKTTNTAITPFKRMNNNLNTASSEQQQAQEETQSDEGEDEEDQTTLYFTPNQEDLAFFRATCIEARLTFVSEDMSDLYNLKTPQGKAFNWILNEDTRALHPDADNLVQRFVLAVLYYATAGSNWHHATSHWLSSLHECHWKHISRGITYGVTECDDQHRITKLQLADNNLRGNLPFELGCLTKLQVLDLNLNYLHGHIPSSLVFLEHLKSLHLNNNNLAGTIPSELGLLTKLEAVQLEVNDFVGEVPSDLCALTTNETLSILMVDCLGSKIKCSCCTLCCDHVTGFCARVDQYGFISDDFILYDQLF